MCRAKRPVVVLVLAHDHRQIHVDSARESNVKGHIDL